MRSLKKGIQKQKYMHANNNETKLTPPALSKWVILLLKSIRSPLNDHEKTTSMDGSLDTWQGRTTLSPTITSVSQGGLMMTVFSVGQEKVLLEHTRSWQMPGISRITIKIPKFFFQRRKGHFNHFNQIIILSHFISNLLVYLGDKRMYHIFDPCTCLLLFQWLLDKWRRDNNSLVISSLSEYVDESIMQSW